MSSRAMPSPVVPRRWDPLVKLTHWGIAICVLANAVLTEEGSGWHIWVGYALAALLVLRLLWGFVGPADARFSAFPPSPRRAFDHVREIRKGEMSHHSSHNPLGALMVYALWICLGVIIATGIAMAGPPPANPNTGGEEHEHGISQRHEQDAERGEDSHDTKDEGVAKELHELAVDLLYVLIALHLAGVLFETRRSGKEIVLAMLPGGTTDWR